MSKLNAFLLNSRFAEIAIVVSLLTLISLLLIPFATNGIWFDDAQYAQTWDFLHRFKMGLWSYSLDTVKGWLYGSGRIIFSFFPIYAFFYLLKDNELAVRLVDVALILSHVGLVVYLLRLVHVSWRTIGVYILILFSLFQIRPFYDPVASYAVFYKFLGLAITLSLIFLVKWRQTEKTSFLVASNITALLSLFCYEINIIYIPIALAAIWTSSNPKFFRNVLITLIPATIFLVMTYLARHHAPRLYFGTTFGSLQAVPLTYLKQLIGCLPGIYYLIQGHHSDSFSKILASFITTSLAWIVAALSLICSWLLLKFNTIAITPYRIPKGILATALAFVFLPPFLIAASAKYQAELQWGLAYLPVYYQYFGLALVLALIVEKLVTAKNARKYIFLLIPLYAFYVTLNWISNRFEAASHDLVYVEPKHSLIHEIKRGLLDVVKEGDIIETKVLPFYINSTFLYGLTGKNFALANESFPARKDAIRYQLARPYIDGKGFVWQLRLLK
ncbi:MAG: hypothetical protein H0U57_09815 [Tatlockia sp.]|nr:hypothetical protein [Tatlockia sp.]